jgi:hypothetical protein
MLTGLTTHFFNSTHGPDNPPLQLKIPRLLVENNSKYFQSTGMVMDAEYMMVGEDDGE